MAPNVWVFCVHGYTGENVAASGNMQNALKSLNLTSLKKKSLVCPLSRKASSNQHSQKPINEVERDCSLLHMDERMPHHREEEIMCKMMWNNMYKP